MARILIVDDEESIREWLEILLRREGHEITAIGDGLEALQTVAGQVFDLVITDLRLGKVSGQEILEAVKRYSPSTEVILITAFATTENAIEVLKAGAYDYITKPFKVDELRLVVTKALEKHSLVRENARLKEELGGRIGYADLVGKSPAMQSLYQIIDKVAPTRSTVLITGESGAGKELVARALHARSPRAASPFIAVNCGAIPESLMESELFGHVKGAFTGAHQDRQGFFAAADRGTIFLDEIGELPQSVQVKLLRVLQDQRVRPVGGVKDKAVDVRLIAATNRDLQDDVNEGRFREDLYYRLNVIQIRVPALRERGEDILVLADTFLERFAAQNGRRLTLSKEVAAALLDHPFPGNVRELQNLMERAVALADGETVELDSLPAAMTQQRRGGALVGEIVIPEQGLDLTRRLEDIELAYLRAALEATGGVKKEAARLLGLSFRSFRYRLDKLEEGGTEDD